MFRRWMTGLLITLSLLFAGTNVVFAAEVTFLRQWGSYGTGEGQFNSPRGVAVDGEGNVYVPDYWNNRIQVFAADGTFLRQWGSSGQADWQFSRPYNVVVDGAGTVYVASSGRLQAFTAEGTFLRKFDRLPTLYNMPSDVAVDGAGNVYVLESYASSVRVFTADGQLLRQWGSYGYGKDAPGGTFNYPWGIAVDGADNVYVTDMYNGRIQVFAADGTFLRQWRGRGYGIAVDSSGNVFVTDVDRHRIQVFTAEGTLLHEWGNYGNAPGQFKAPYGVAVDGAGNVYVADAGNYRIQVFHFEGATPPIADAGPDQSVHAGTWVTLDGRGSSDPSGRPLSYAWRLAEKPAGSAASLQYPETYMPGFQADVPGDFLIELVVNVMGSASSIDTVLVSATNTPPIANAGPDQTIAGSHVQLDGTGSEDGEGDPLLYSWALVQKPATSSAVLSDSAAVKPTFVADVKGQYVFSLTVSDPWSSSKPSDFVTIVFEKADQTITFDPLSPKVYGDAPFIVSATASSGLPVSFSASGGSCTVAGNLVTITGAGSCTIAAQQAGNANYNPAAEEQPLLITKADQMINWGDPAPIVYGTPLGATQLNATVTVPGQAPAGALTYTPAAGTVLDVGMRTLWVSAAETENYRPAAKTVTLTVISRQELAVRTLQELIQLINRMDPLAFKNSNMANALINKINAALTAIEQGNYAAALDKLQKDILTKTDGCAVAGAPDKNDWLKRCFEQDQVYPLVEKAINLLEGL